MIMRKEIIKDIKFSNSYNRYTLSRLFRQHILRKDVGGRRYLHPATSKVPNPHTRNEWITQPNGESSTSLIVINDPRQEIAQVGERALITSSLIFEELLNCNRGKQDNEYERNRFFVQDDTYNSEDLRNPAHILTLDILWYMDENNVDAVEIEVGKEVTTDLRFLSKRYRDIVSKDIDEAQKVTMGILKPHYQKMVDKFKEEDGTTVKWSESSYRRDWGFLGVDEYSAQVEILKEYYNYRQDTEDKPVKRFVSFVKKVMDNDEGEKQLSASDYMYMCARHFGYVDISDEDYFTGIALKQRVPKSWRKIADSAFKRNCDWNLDSGNFIKSEVLKLRRQMEEGTFDE